MNKYVIIHGYRGNPQEHQWFLDIKDQLKKLGHQVIIPQMPTADYPNLRDWINTIKPLIQDENTVIVGHSLGGTTILRLAETSDKIKKAIFISTPITSVNIKEIQNFFTKPFNWQKIKKNIFDTEILYSIQDQYVPISHAKTLTEKLNGKLHIYKNQNHGFDTLKTKEFFKYIL